MALFIGFLIGGVSALILPGTTSRAVENGIWIRQKIVYFLPSTWLRVLLFLFLGAVVIFIAMALRTSPGLGHIIAFLLAVLLGNFITDYLLHPRGESETARLLLLGGAATLLIVFSIFPPAYLRSVLSKLNLAGISIELIQAGANLAPEIPRAIFVDGEPVHDADLAATALRAVHTASSLLNSYASLADKLSRYSASESTGPRRDQEPNGRIEIVYGSEAARDLFENYLIPLTSCASVVRASAMTEDADFIFPHALHRALRRSLMVLPADQSKKRGAPEWINGNDIVTVWRHLNKLYRELISQDTYSQTRATETIRLRCEGLAAESEVRDELRELFHRLDGSLVTNTLLYPAFAAAVMAGRNDGAGAAEVIAIGLTRVASGGTRAAASTRPLWGLSEMRC